MWWPMFESESVSCMSSPWENEEYVWLDLPETIKQILYLIMNRK